MSIHYRKKASHVEAMRVPGRGTPNGIGEAHGLIIAWFTTHDYDGWSAHPWGYNLDGPHQQDQARGGTWIIRDPITGQFSALPHEDFEEQYEKAEREIAP